MSLAIRKVPLDRLPGRQPKQCRTHRGEHRNLSGRSVRLARINEFDLAPFTAHIVHVGDKSVHGDYVSRNSVVLDDNCSIQFIRQRPPACQSAKARVIDKTHHDSVQVFLTLGLFHILSFWRGFMCFIVANTYECRKSVKQNQYVAPRETIC